MGEYGILTADLGVNLSCFRIADWEPSCVHSSCVRERISLPRNFERGRSMNLFVGNLPYAMDSAKLGELFAQAGAVVSAKVISDKYTGRSRGFGFVEFGTDEEGKKAIELFNGQAVEGRPLVVNEARPPKAS